MSFRVWTDDEIEMLRRDYPNTTISVDDVAQNLKRSRSAVIIKANHLKLFRQVGRKKKRKPENYSKPQADQNTVERPASPPEQPAHPFWTPRRDLKVWATEGRYQAISELAKELKRPQQFVLVRWHRLNAEG